MEKYSRNQRVALIAKTLVENPNRIMSLNYFTELFNAAKSTISEDLLILRETLDKQGQGMIETIAGASGGVKYRVRMPEADKAHFLEEMVRYLSEPSRIVPGNFLYVTDLMMNPHIVGRAGAILAEHFQDLGADHVITVETKGIPLAYEVARCLGINLIVVRRNTKISEGTAVSVNYLTGDQGMLSVMSLAKRSLKPDSRLIFIDDFLRGGGTVRGIIDLLHEFDSRLAGVGVMIASRKITDKTVPVPFVNICDYYGVEENGRINIESSNRLYNN